MTLRTRFLITALFVCHYLPAGGLVTRQLLSDSQDAAGAKTEKSAQVISSTSGSAPCAKQAAGQDEDSTTICALQQEKIEDVYKLHGNAEIHYRTYILKADEMTYDQNSGEATATGHVTLDGGPNDDHIRASHGTYNLTAETGRFYDVTATTGFRFHGHQVILTSSAPFAFSGKVVEKDSPDHYLVYDGTITTCELPSPAWKFDARKVVVDVGGNASIYHSAFLLHSIPIFYFPYATHPVSHEARHTGFLIPTGGRSSTNGNEIGDSFYWVINRSLDATVGAEYFSKRGFSQRGEFRARPSDTSYVDLGFFGVVDRGISVLTGTDAQGNNTYAQLREGGQEARLTADGNFAGFRAVSNIDYLSSFLFRLAFNDVYTQAINSEVKSQVFLSKAYNGFSLSGMVERYQNFFQTTNSDGTLSNPPMFDDVQIWHIPSVDASSVDRQIRSLPLYWSFDLSLAGVSRSEPGFRTNPLARFDFMPDISMPLQFHGWALRPGLTLHETYYSQRFVNGASIPDATNRQALDAYVEVQAPAVEKVFDKEWLGRKWKHVIEPRAVYRIVAGVNDFANVLHFDEHDILSNTNEVEYGFTTRLYAKRPPSSTRECESTSMNGLAVGSPAPEQSVPWQRSYTVENQPCVVAPDVKEVVTWELFQKYFLDPTFGGALVTGQRNVFTTTEELTGIAFLTQPRHLSPAVSRLRVSTGNHTDTEWDLDYDFQLGRINASTLLVNYNLGSFTVSGGDAFLQIPQTVTSPPSLNLGTCGPAEGTTQVTCKFQQFRAGVGYGSLTRPGFSAAASLGFDAEAHQLQFATAQTTYNWNCCGLTLEYRRYAIANVRNENLFRFNFSLANIGSFGNLRKQERLY